MVSKLPVVTVAVALGRRELEVVDVEVLLVEVGGRDFLAPPRGRAREPRHMGRERRGRVRRRRRAERGGADEQFGGGEDGRELVGDGGASLLLLVVVQRSRVCMVGAAEEAVGRVRSRGAVVPLGLGIGVPIRVLQSVSITPNNHACHSHSKCTCPTRRTETSRRPACRQSGAPGQSRGAGWRSSAQP